MLPRILSKTAARDLILRQSRCRANPSRLSIARRAFSDRMLGYSPMSPAAPAKPTGERRIPTAEDVTTAGGVWAPTSAKRDKLGELKVELTEDQETLDDAATSSQLQDLYLVDGIRLIAKVTDSLSDTETPQIQEFSEWLVDQQSKMPEAMDKDKCEAHLAIIGEQIAVILEGIPREKALRDVRDYLDPDSIQEKDELVKQISGIELQDDAFVEAVLLFRLQLIQAAMEHFLASWDAILTVSDGDVDRAATSGRELDNQASTISTANVYKYLFAHISGSCSDRVDAAWELVDKDGDGLLEQSEMSLVAELCVAPVQLALPRLFELALNQEPIAVSESDEIIIQGGQTPAPTKGWRERKREARHKKRLTKMFDKAIQNHFEDEVEMPHRLRCIYAWAEKAHQDNQVESIMVESGGWSDRKRYVELSPKISLSEFREVQVEHFTHLDRIGTEILKSYREDLWVLQGKGRERKELVRDSALFLTAVCIADYLILAS